MVKKKPIIQIVFGAKSQEKLRIVFNPKGIPPMGLVELN